MPRICVLSAWDKGYQDFADLTWPNKLEYCRANGYEAKKVEVDEGGYWLKVKALADTLPDYDWVVWMDADLVIMDMTKRLEDFLDEQHDFIFSYDLNGLNVGFMFLKNTRWARCLVCQWDEDGGRFHACICPEQTALAYLLYREPKDRWKVVCQKLFNSYDYALTDQSFPEGQYEPGDFVIHMAGVDWDKKLDKLKEYLGRVRHSDHDSGMSR